jgi:hypothetical protein
LGAPLRLVSAAFSSLRCETNKGVFVFLFSWPIAESDSVTKKTILNRLFTAFAFKFVPIKSKDKSSCQNSIE